MQSRPVHLAKQYVSWGIIDNKAKWLHNLDENKIILLSQSPYKDKIIVLSDTNLKNELNHEASHVFHLVLVVQISDRSEKAFWQTAPCCTRAGRRDQGIKKIGGYLYDGKPAALYKSLNYNYEGRRLKKSDDWNDGTYVDEILLSKLINPSEQAWKVYSCADNVRGRRPRLHKVSQKDLAFSKSLTISKLPLSFGLRVTSEGRDRHKHAATVGVKYRLLNLCASWMTKCAALPGSLVPTSLVLSRSHASGTFRRWRKLVWSIITMIGNDPELRPNHG